MKISYALHEATDLPTPALVFYPQIIRRNIETILKMAGDPARLRPHVKTHKTREITQMQLDLGITKHKCATIAEAEMLASVGVRDVFMAYPVIGANAVRLARLAVIYPQTFFSACIDSHVGVDQLQSACEGKGKVGFLVDLNVGMNRTGILPEQAVALYKYAALQPDLIPNGLHAYDGQNNSELYSNREAGCIKTLAISQEIKRTLEEQKIACPRLVIGGTPAFPAYCRMQLDQNIELSPGTFTLHDHGYGSKFKEFADLQPAAVVVGRLISKPTHNRLTFDLGTKAVSADPPIGKRMILLQEPDAVPVGHNEEHYVVETANAEQWKIGQTVLAIPVHVCTTVAIYNEAFVVEDGVVTGSWPIAARARKITV